MDDGTNEISGNKVGARIINDIVVKIDLKKMKRWWF